MGRRPLIEEELLAVFDLPSFVGWQSEFFSQILPLQLFPVSDAVLELIQVDTGNDALASIGPELTKRPQLVASGPESTCDTAGITTPVCWFDNSKVWLPELALWLPGTWTDTPIADRAVKADHAPIDFLPWHQRTLLLLPWCTGSKLLYLERLGLQWWHKNLVASFHAYMIKEYSTTWRQLLPGAGK